MVGTGKSTAKNDCHQAKYDLTFGTCLSTLSEDVHATDARRQDERR